MATFNKAEEPASELGRYRILSPRCGLRVSPLCLGAMSIGTSWSKVGMGVSDQDSSEKLLDTFYELGGNFIDTANNYQDGESEDYIGQWMEKRKIRDEMVIATKYTTFYEPNAKFRANYAGNHIKSMHVSVEASLKKLRTSYIDILYLHWWDHTTSVEEVMQGLNNLVKQGKVLYLGISDSPAWIVSKANQYARDHGLAQFVVYQGRWNAALRDFERDILPMAYDEGMALLPWDVMGGGKFQTKKQIEERKKNGEGLRAIFGDQQSEEQVKISEALDTIAQEFGVGIQAVAIAYVMQKAPHTVPMVGGRKPEHLKSNLDALKITLTAKHFEDIEAAVAFKPGFPHDFIGKNPATNGGKNTNFLLDFTGHYSFAEGTKPIVPKQQ